MTVSSDIYSPLSVVVWLQAFRAVIKALQDSPKPCPYRIRAITRDVSKDAAKDLDRIGCDVPQGDADDPAS